MTINLVSILVIGSTQTISSIVAKGRLDSSKKGFKGETKCLILLDDFTKIVMACPAASKSTEECVKALKHFGGRRPLVEFHADNILEYEATASQLGLVYDATVPYRKTAIINRAIRTLEDVTRCCRVQVGNFHELWPLALRYAASASTISNCHGINSMTMSLKGFTFLLGLSSRKTNCSQIQPRGKDFSRIVPWLEN